MRRSTRLILTITAIVAIVVLLGWAAHSFNLVGAIVSAHTPPQHGG